MLLFKLPSAGLLLTIPLEDVFWGGWNIEKKPLT
jgi:hypothetical protein